jgi:Zn-dependent protease with chaperone function
MAHLPQLVLCTMILVAEVAGWAWGPVAPWAFVLLLPLPHLIVLSGRNLVGAGSFRMGAMVARIGRFSGTFAFAVLVLCCGWVQWLREAFGARLDLAGWPEVALLWAVLPFMIFEVLTIDAQSRAAWPAGASRLNWRSFHLRMFASTLVPPGLYLGAAALVGSSRWFRVQVEQVELVGAAVFVLLIVGLAVYLPVLLQASWRTHDLPPGALRSSFEEISRTARFTARRVLVWETGQLMANAAIVGLLPSRRIVILSDALLTQLDEDELRAVYAHEMGHSYHNHVPVFLAWAVGVFLVADLSLRAYGPTGEMASLGIMVMFLGGWGLIFGWMSRRFELQADLFAMRTLGSSSALISALEKIAGSLDDTASWRHFSGRRRARFLEEAAQDPDTANRFEGRLRRISFTGYALCALGLVGELCLMTSGLPEDRTWAAIGLGDYSLAQERVEQVTNPDPQLARMVGRTLDLEGVSGSGADSLERAWIAWQAGDTTAALDWAFMSYLQGEHGAHTIARILEGLERNEPVGGAVSTGNLRSPWKEALTQALTKARVTRLRDISNQ